MRENDKSTKAGSPVNTDDQTTVDQQKRRKLLSTIAAGGAAATLLPQKWSKPVVDSVMLPAHAQMSPGVPSSSGGLVACTVTGWLFFTGTFTSSASSASSYSFSLVNAGTTNTGATIFVSSHTTSAAEYTFAALSGTVTSIGTHTGPATYTATTVMIVGNTSVSQYERTIELTWVFDSTCFA